MRREIAKYLHDIQSTVQRPQEFTSGKSFADYKRETMLRSAVEREFIVIAEAISLVVQSSAPADATVVESGVHSTAATTKSTSSGRHHA